MDFKLKDKYDIEDLKFIMHILRGENGCPWDKEQNHKSIRKNFIEETYEVIEAIDNDDIVLLREELGDVLLQVVFHSQIEQEQNSFNFDDVASDICKKLIVRHPHIFADTLVNSSQEVLDNWNSIKQKQKGQTTATETLLSVPKQLPALMRSSKVQERAMKAGFDYPNVAMALSDLKSEIIELEMALTKSDMDNVCEELGDILFSGVNVARLLGYDAEEVLFKSCDKFIQRFSKVESIADENNISIKDADIDILNDLWKKAKKY